MNTDCKERHTIINPKVGVFIGRDEKEIVAQVSPKKYSISKEQV